jgi:hypothetical protein
VEDVGALAGDAVTLGGALRSRGGADEHAGGAPDEAVRLPRPGGFGVHQQGHGPVDAALHAQRHARARLLGERALEQAAEGADPLAGIVPAPSAVHRSSVQASPSSQSAGTHGGRVVVVGLGAGAVEVVLEVDVVEVGGAVELVDGAVVEVSVVLVEVVVVELDDDVDVVVGTGELVVVELGTVVLVLDVVELVVLSVVEVVDVLVVSVVDVVDVVAVVEVVSVVEVLEVLVEEVVEVLVVVGPGRAGMTTGSVTALFTSSSSGRRLKGSRVTRSV